MEAGDQRDARLRSIATNDSETCVCLGLHNVRFLLKTSRVFRSFFVDLLPICNHWRPFDARRAEELGLRLQTRWLSGLARRVVAAKLTGNILSLFSFACRRVSSSTSSFAVCRASVGFC